MHIVYHTCSNSENRARQTDACSTAFFSWQPRKAGTRKVKSIWIIVKQEMMGWQWHQLDHMQIICTPLQTDNRAPHHSISTGWMLLLMPGQQWQKHQRHAEMKLFEEKLKINSVTKFWGVWSSLVRCLYFDPGRSKILSPDSWLYIGWSDTVTYLWLQCDRHFVGQHVVLCVVKWWRFVALFE